MDEIMEKRPALGKGLSALIPDLPEIARGTPLEVDIDRIGPNRLQPRSQFDEARLDELAQSIRSNGVIQPIVVRASGERFEIIAGERRWRAAQKAGLHRVPVIVECRRGGTYPPKIFIEVEVSRRHAAPELRRGSRVAP